MKYKTILDAAFLSRPNRFIARVLLDGKEETVHVKNTGRCRELLLPGADVRLEVSDNPARKTKYDLVAVRKEGLGWVNIDSQAPNKVVKEWLETRGFDAIHPEFSYGKSRIDFAMEKAGQLYLLEVKGCTLEVNGNWLLSGRAYRTRRQAPAGTDPGPAGRGPLRGGFCDPDGRNHRGATQFGYSPGFRGGSGPGKGGWGESSLFALPGRQRFSGHCGSERRIRQNGRQKVLRISLRLSAVFCLEARFEAWMSPVAVR